MKKQKQLHLLLVEDDDAHAMIVQKSIQAADSRATVDRVSGGVEAVAYVRREGKYRGRPQPSMILLDLKLRGMDGHDVLRTLKTDDELRLIPVVVLCTSDAERDVVKAYRHHVNSYLVKPTVFAEFRRLIDEVVHYWGTWNRRPRRLQNPASPSDG